MLNPSEPRPRFDQLAQLYPIADVAEVRLGVRIHSRTSEYALCYSPFNQEKNASCRLYRSGPRAGKFKDFSSGQGGDVFDLVALTQGLKNGWEAYLWLSGGVRETRDLPPAPERTVTPESDLNKDLTSFARSSRRLLTLNAQRYLRSRDIADVAALVGVGSSDDRVGFSLRDLPVMQFEDKPAFPDKKFLGRLILPYWEGGVCVGVNGRLLPGEPEGERKYRQAQFRSKLDPFMLHRALEQDSGDVWVLEGEIDAMSLSAACPDWAVVGLPGTSYRNRDGLSKLEGKTVWLVMDEDEAGRKSRAALEALLLPYVREVIHVHYPPDASDMNDLLLKKGRDWVAGYFTAALKGAVRRRVRRLY